MTLFYILSVYTITIGYEYFSISMSFKANNKQAKETEHTELPTFAIRTQQLGYGLSWLLGSLFLIGMYFVANLISNNWLAGLVFVIGVILLFVLRNFVYSFVSNAYSNSQILKLKDKLKE